MDPTTLPPFDLPAWAQTALAYAAILLAALTALAHGLRWAVPRLRAIALKTETLADDAVVEWLARALHYLTVGLDWVRYLMPQVRLGAPTPTPDVPPPPPSRPSRPTYVPPLPLLALAGILVTLAGCGTWASRARTTIEVSAVAVDVADRAVASALTRTCASVAELPAASPERAAALDACLSSHHYDDAITAIRVADRALRAAQAAVDAGERAGDPAPWRGVAACLAVAVQEVLGAVQAAGVTVPPALTVGASMLAGVVGACTAPESAETAGGPGIFSDAFAQPSWRTGPQAPVMTCESATSAPGIIREFAKRSAHGPLREAAASAPRPYGIAARPSAQHEEMNEHAEDRGVDDGHTPSIAARVPTRKGVLLTMPKWSQAPAIALNPGVLLAPESADEGPVTS